MVDQPDVANIPKTRRIRFQFDSGGGGKYFVNDDIVFSHFVAGLSASFPPGEEAFIRSVRAYSDQITDPVLKKKVAGFIGQESVHGQQHRALNDQLADKGYWVQWWDSEQTKAREKRFEKRIGRRRHLAMTAASEHFTAVLAQRVLGTEEVQAIPGDPEVWNLLNWHALEELEHKAVAFDVYRAVGGDERTRIRVMRAMLALGVPLVISTLLISLARDANARRQPVRLVREAHRLFTGPLVKGMWADFRRYLRPGFHPDDIDTSALLDRWQRELFGEHGALIDNLR